MLRPSRLVFLVVAFSCAPAAAQNWAEKLFTESSHDFGPVARAAKIEHIFAVKNDLQSEVHVASVRSSCGCTMPRIGTPTIKPGEQGQIIAAFNTNAFSGHRHAQVTVTFDKPSYAEVRLQISGHIRTDVVLNPSEVALGSVEQGSPVEKKVAIDYAGRNDWKILDVQSGSPLISASVAEKSRGNGRVAYELSVQLSGDAPQGYFKDQLTLKTNDARATQFPVMVQGAIVSDFNVSPGSLMVGTLYPGQEVTRQIVIKAKNPLKIISATSSSGALAFDNSDDAKPVQLVGVTFTAPLEAGKFATTIQIRTDIVGHELIEIPASGQVVLGLTDSVSND